MDWNFIAAVGELISAAGVIASLIYLARQVRSNAAQTQEAAVQTRHAAAQSVISKFNAAMESFSNREHAEIFGRGIKGLANLDGYLEITQFSARMLTVYRPYEELFYYRKSGVIDDWLWHSLERMMGDVSNNPGVAEWWCVRRDWFSPAFHEHMERVMSGAPRDLESDYDRVSAQM